MLDRTYESFIQFVVIALAVFIARYLVTVTNLSRIFCGVLATMIIGLHIYLLMGLSSPLEFVRQLTMFYENEVIAGYGRYVNILLFNICLLNAVGFGKKT